MASSPIGGALPAQMPPSASVGKTDKQIVKTTAAKLTAAIKGTSDPELKMHFSTALAQLNNYLAQDTKGDKKGQGPKVSTKAVREAKPKSRKA